MKLLKALISIMWALGGLSIVITIIGLVSMITLDPEVFSEFSYNILDVLMVLLVGVVWLIVAVGLSKRKKWAWYLGTVMFIYSAVHNFVIGSTINIIAGIIGLIFLIILIKEKKVIFEQLKTNTSIS